MPIIISIEIILTKKQMSVFRLSNHPNYRDIWCLNWHVEICRRWISILVHPASSLTTFEWLNMNWNRNDFFLKMISHLACCLLAESPWRTRLTFLLLWMSPRREKGRRPPERFFQVETRSMQGEKNHVLSITSFLYVNDY